MSGAKPLGVGPAGPGRGLDRARLAVAGPQPPVRIRQSAVARTGECGLANADRRMRTGDRQPGPAQPPARAGGANAQRFGPRPFKPLNEKSLIFSFTCLKGTL